MVKSGEEEWWRCLVEKIVLLMLIEEDFEDVYIPESFDGLCSTKNSSTVSHRLQLSLLAGEPPHIAQTVCSQPQRSVGMDVHSQ